MSQGNRITINNELSQFFRQACPYIPTPQIRAALEPIDYTQLSDIAAIAMKAWELSHSGLNGLRFGTYEESEKKIVCVSTEKCSSSSEDLSSFEEYLGSTKPSDIARRAYWFTRVFNNCSSIALCLKTVLDILNAKHKSASINYEDLTFMPESAEIVGFSVLKKAGFESLTLDSNNMVPAPEGHHSVNESHNHVVIAIKTQKDEEYVIDLSGPQFGIFGQDPIQPYLIVEPIERWKTRFRMCRPTAPAMSYGAKNVLVKAVSTIIGNAYLNKKSASIKKKDSKSSTGMVDEEAVVRAKLAEMELMKMLETDECTTKTEAQKKNKK